MTVQVDLQPEIERLRGLLDDRKKQQEKADEYAPLLQTGRKRLVEYAGLIEVGAQLEPKREEIFAWLNAVRKKLTEDFGQAVAAHFNLGIPETVLLGKSEPEEHQMRLRVLDALIMQMRSGELHLIVP